MPNLVLQSNTANRTFNIQHAVLEMPVEAGAVELIITPISTRSIDAKDFTYGYLPSQISDIQFQNLGDKVIASVFIKRTIDLKKTLNIPIPISGKSFLKKDYFNIVETTNVDPNVLVTDASSNLKSVDGNKITYNISNDLNKKSLMFTKKFTIVGDYYFSTQPTYTIKNNSTRYTVVSSVEKNASGKVISKTFDFFYTSPGVVSQKSDTEISFQANANLPSIKLSEVVSTKKEENKIYYVDQGRKIGKEGGIKKIAVKGVPGTTFKILISNSSGNTYNARTGAFEAGGGMIEGVVPTMIPGLNYGEARYAIRIPKTITSDTITVQFIDEKPIDHSLITSPTTADTITSGSAGAIQATVSSAATLTISVEPEAGAIDFAGPIVTLPGGAESTGEILLGKGNSEALKITQSGIYDFTFIVELPLATSNKFVIIKRQPLFVMPTDGVDNFIAWDSDETKKVLAQQADGTAIPSDWDFETAGLVGGLDVSIKAKVVGIGSIEATTGSFSSVAFKGKINVSNVGTTSSEVKLTLLNFLTLVTPS